MILRCMKFTEDIQEKWHQHTTIQSLLNQCQFSELSPTSEVYIIFWDPANFGTMLLVMSVSISYVFLIWESVK